MKAAWGIVAKHHIQVLVANIYLFLGLISACGPALWPAQAYTPAPVNTIPAPTKTPIGNSLPNNQILAKRLTSFRKLSMTVTPNADVRAPKRLTPRMQAYCVKEFRRRFIIWIGTRTTKTLVLLPFESSLSTELCQDNDGAREGVMRPEVGIWIMRGGESTRRRSWRHRPGMKGANKGSERKCE